MKIDDSCHSSNIYAKSVHEIHISQLYFVVLLLLYNTLLNSDRLIGCLWSRDIE